MIPIWLIGAWCALGGVAAGLMLGMSYRRRVTSMWRNIAVTYCEEYMRRAVHKDWKFPETWK